MKISRKQIRMLIEQVINESKLDPMEIATLKQLAIQAQKNPKSRQGKQLKGILTGMRDRDPEKFAQAMEDETIRAGALAVGVS